MGWRASVIDAAVGAAAFVLSAAILAGSAPVAAGLREPDAGAYVLLALCSASAVLRRWAPVAALLVGSVASLAFAAAQYPVALTPVVLLAVYSAGTVTPAWRARVSLGAAVALALLATTLSPGPTDLNVPALVIAAWLLGRYVSSRRASTAELQERNRLLEAAQLELAEHAVTEERLRIARELHDVVAHTMSVVAVHAGTGRMVAEDDPAAARQALATIETATRASLLEMRRLLGVLRGDGAGPERPDRAGDTGATPLAPAPGLADLDALVADVVRSGVTVEVRIEGDRGDVPAGVDLSAYRIVQEALTNVIKHAGRARTTVVVRYGHEAVDVEVDDEGRGPAPAPSTAGLGLAGMRERVAIYGGCLDAGPRPGGGFRVAAHLPYRGA